MRVPEEPVCIDIFRQNPVFTSLHLKSPVHVHRLSIQKPQVWELSRLCPETSTKLCVHEFSFWSLKLWQIFLFVLLSFIVACCWFYSVRSRVSVVDCQSLLSVVHYSWWLRVVFRLSKFVAGCGWSLLFDNVGCWPSSIDCRFSAVECPYRLLKKISLSVPTAQLCCDSSAALTCPFKGTQGWEFFWLQFWILCHFIVSYAQILRFCKKHFLIRPLLGEIQLFRLVWD